METGTFISLIASAIGAAGLVARIWWKRQARLDAEARMREEQAQRELSEYIETRKAIDDAAEDIGDDPAAARRWLREYLDR